MDFQDLFNATLLVAPGSTYCINNFKVLTNTSGQVRYRSSNSSVTTIKTGIRKLRRFQEVNLCLT